MAQHLGDGAEAHARFKQYEYRANSRLVLTTDSQPRDTHDINALLFRRLMLIDRNLVQEDEGEDDDDEMGGGIDDDEMQEANEGMSLDVLDINAYWLQRNISDAYERQIDPQQRQKLAEEVLKILAEGDDREVETKLLVNLQFEKFSLLKLLLRNRLKIVWCTRLARAEDQDERNKIEEEMLRLGPELAAILDQLHASAKERQKILEKNIRAL